MNLKTVVGALLLSISTATGCLAQNTDEPTAQMKPAMVALPALFSVSGISSDDVLNVRSGPSAKFRDLGDLKLGTKIEVTQIAPNGQWARIIWNERNAWVSNRFLTHVPTQQLLNTKLPANLQCFGTEPFWNLKMVQGKEITFEGLGLLPVSEPLDWERVSANHTLRFAIGSASWRALMQKKICHDGMSDTEYGLQIDLMGTSASDAVVLSGCCRLVE
ncbi:hypothetical protein BFP76_04855 [Amylibacter kogurei]|uniref:SH3b domain-containing protein n=1 Tax=Paramylibacter kogurei TaxID=1889778 RepID=A0A2G5K698_9RHOB|nr:SH3 domain-containing protein [Amylibacter kogurei]PIB24533.1 hypothetical protein BFP76_04855 [Amylibacter kogurei]